VNVTRFSALTRHCFGRFFDRESLSPQGDMETNVAQTLALLAVPGMLTALWLLPFDVRGWMLVGARYFPVAYSMTVMGFVMVFEWDSLFPDARDYLILTPLPIRLSSLFAAKLAALAGFLALFVLDINALGTVLFPAVAGGESYGGAVLAHRVSVGAGALFMALSAAAIQGVLLLVLSGRMFRRVSAAVQCLLMAVLVMTLFLHFLVVANLRHLVVAHSSVLAWFPYFWFLGLYEWLSPATLDAWPLAELAPRALVAIAIAGGVFLLTFLAGYRRHARQAIAGTVLSPAGPGRLRAAAGALLNRTVLKSPLEQAAFHFITQTIARSLKHRLFLATYGGFGAALAVLSYTSGPLGSLTLPLTLSFFLVSGLRAAFNFPSELAANWVFQVSESERRSEYLAAMRKWIVVCGILPLFALLALVEFRLYHWLTALFHLSFGITLSLVLMQIMFFTFRKVPFTCSYFPGKANLVGLSVLYIYGFTTYSYTMAALEFSLARNPVGAVAFFALAAGVYTALGRYRERGVRIMNSLDYEDAPDPVVRTLNLHVS